MGYKTSSTRFTQAKSAQSSDTVAYNNSTGGTSVAGSGITASTVISTVITTPGAPTTTTTVASGPTIANVQYLDANNAVISGDIAVSTAGGNILINGTGFVANSNVYVNNSLVSNTFLSSTQIRAILPAASAGNVSLMIFTPTNAGTINTNGIRYSGTPTWTTAAVSFQNATAANVALVASSDSTLTYTLQAGSTLPTGISLVSAGYLSGTATGYSVNTSSTAVIIATDLEGQATQQTLNITVNVADPQFPYTTLLLNGETSVTPFTKDASTNNVDLTIAGDTKATKFTPYRGDGYYSNYFNGTSSLQTPAASITNIIGTNGVTSASTFTMEGWIYQTQRQTGTVFPALMGDMTPSATNCYWSFGPSNTGLLQFFWYDGANKSATGSTTIPLNTWTHIAVSISSGAIKLFVNGNLETITGTSALTNATGTTGYFAFGMENSGGSGANAYYGYVSNLRVVKSALYSATFTPSTTPLTAVANTGLLTAQSNRFIDNSSNAYALTLTSTPQVSPAIPFAASSSYANYGSAYFNGTTSYLSQSSNSALAFGTGDFTVEYWAYFNSFSTTPVVIDGRTGINDAALSDYYSTSGVPTLYWSTSNIATSSIAVQLNTWTHIAYTRQGTTLKIWVNGVQGASVTNSTSLVSSKFNIGLIYSGSVNYHNGYVADFRINKGTALYTATFTPPTAPLTAVANTQFLALQYNGGANNYGIIDNSQFNNIITRNGNATQGTFSPYSQTGWSNYCNGTTDYLSLTTAAIGTNQFTVEAWVYLTSNSNYSGVFSTWVSTTASIGVLLGFLNTGVLYGGVGNGGAADAVTGASAVTINTWHHIAVTRNASNIVTLWLDGVSLGTVTSTKNANATTANIGKYYTNTSQYYLPGYISNLRVVNGTALYTGNFTPSVTPLTAVANTQLLTCQSNQFKDNSTNNSALTLTGTPSVQTYSPFAPGVAYNPSLHGGSAYFDGVGDYLLITEPGPAPAGTDVTVECWVYPTNITSRNFLVSANTASGAGDWAISIETTGAVGIWIDSYSATKITTTTTLALNQWHHIALVKTSGTVYAYVNGVKDAGSYAQAGAFGASSSIAIGAYNVNKGSLTFGYISDVRYVKGASMYTGATVAVPTAPLTSPTTIPASLLLNFTNGGIIDAHSSSVNESVGNTQLSTAVKKFGTASIYFDGSGDYLYQLNTPNYQFGTGDYTVEFWINPTNFTSLAVLFDFRTSNGATGGALQIYTTTGGVITVYGGSSTATLLITAAAAITAGTWTHVALTRSGTSTKLFINGTQSSTTATDATSYGLGALWVGTTAGAGNSYLIGYLDEVRITKGFARYTANFTAPTSAFLGQ